MLNNIITTVLMREGKISLPTIGIIVKADFDGDTTYLFTPSTAKADRNILAMIRSEMDVSHEEAINILDSYIDFVKSIIAKNGKYHLRGVGDILRNSSNVFYFMPLTEDSTRKEQEVEIEQVRDEIVEDEIVVEEVEDNEVKAVVEIVEEKIEEPVKRVFGETLEREEPSRLNERFQPKRLGEIIEGGQNRRFYDKVHSQVVTASEEVGPEIPVPVVASPEVVKEILHPIEEPIAVVEKVVEIKIEQKSEPEPVVEPIKEEPVVAPKRKGLYDIYDKGFRKDYNPLEFKEVRRDPVVPVVPVVPIVQPIVEPQSVVEPTESVVSEEEAVVSEQPEFASKGKRDVVLILSIVVIVLGLVFIAYSYMVKKDLGI